MSLRDVIAMLKWRNHVASQRIHDFLKVFFMFFFQFKIRYLVVSKKKNPICMSGWDRKICPSRSPFVILRQASWCQSVTLGTNFSFKPSHSWWILIVLYYRDNQISIVLKFSYVLMSKCHCFSNRKTNFTPNLVAAELPLIWCNRICS